MDENVEACCSECYWSACMDPTGARRRTQARKGKREAGGAGAARVRRRRAAAAAAAAATPACTPVPSPATNRRGGGRAATLGVAETWDADAVPPLEGTKWLGGFHVGGGQGEQPGSAHAMFEYHCTLWGAMREAP